MAAIFADSPEGLLRTAGLVPPSSDYTACWWATIGTPGAGTYQTLYVYLDDSITYTDYVWIGISDGQLFIVDMSGTPLASPPVVAPGLHQFARRKLGNIHTFFVDGVNVGSVTKDISAFTIGEMYLGTDTYPASWDPSKVLDFREWDVALTDAEIAAEFHNVSHVQTRSADLVTNTPLASDLLDDSGNGNDWTASGGTITFQAGPLNTTSALAIHIPTLPATFVQTDIHVGGTTFTVWYDVLAPVGVRAIGAWGFGDLTTYRPEMEVSEPGPGSAIALGRNRPVQFGVTAGSSYPMEIDDVSGNPSPATLTLNVQVAPDFDAVAGSIVVPDDATDLTAILSATVDGEVLQFRHLAPGEAGDILPNGVMVLENDAGGNTEVYDATFALIATLAINATGANGGIRANPTLNKFVAVHKTPNPDQVKLISAAGVIEATYTLTGINNIRAIAINNAGTILYHAPSSGDTSSIRRWDIVGATALSDLVNLGPGRSINDLIVLADDSILAIFVSLLAGPIIRHYSSAGTLLHTYDFSGEADEIFPSGTAPRLARALDDPDSFWLWTHYDLSAEFTADGGISRFRNIRISDGTTITTRDFIEFEFGQYAGPETDAPDARFGNSYSCPFFILPMSVPGGDGPLPVEDDDTGTDLTIAKIGPIVWGEWPRLVQS